MQYTTTDNTTTGGNYGGTFGPGQIIPGPYPTTTFTTAPTLDPIFKELLERILVEIEEIRDELGTLRARLQHTSSMESE